MSSTAPAAPCSSGSPLRRPRRRRSPPRPRGTASPSRRPAPRPTRTPPCRPRPRATRRSRRPPRSRSAPRAPAPRAGPRASPPAPPGARPRRTPRRGRTTGRRARHARCAAASIAPTRGSGWVERPVPMRMPIAADPTLPGARGCRCASCPRVSELTVVALFGPTGVGKTAVAVALAERLRDDGEDPVAVSADALQLYRGLEILTGAPSAAERARARAPARRRAARHRERDRRATTRAAPTRRSTGCSPQGRRPIVVGGTGLYLRAALADLDLRPPPPPGVRERWAARLAAEGAAGAARRARRARPGRRGRDRADGRSARRPRARAARHRRRAAAPSGGQLWTADTRHPTLLVGARRWSARRSTRASTRRVAAMVAAGAEEEVRRAVAAGASAGARQALGFEELLRGDVDGHAHAHPPLREAPADVAAQAARKRCRSTSPAAARGRGRGRDRCAALACDREPARRAKRRRAVAAEQDAGHAVREVAGAGQRLPHPRGRRAPVPAHARGGPAAVLRHFGPGADGVLVLLPPDAPGFVARLRIFNPDGSEAELSGNGAREAILYLRRAGWTDSDTFSIQTAAGEIRPTITGPTTCRVDMGRAALRSKDFPGGGTGRHGRGRRPSLPARVDRQPAVRDPDRRPRRARGARPRRASARRSSTTRASPTAPTSPSSPSSRPDAIRARIFERGVGETLSSGTGACGAAVAHVVRGGELARHRRARRRRAAWSRSTSPSTSTSRAGRCRSTAAS